MGGAFSIAPYSRVAIETMAVATIWWILIPKYTWFLTGFPHPTIRAVDTPRRIKTVITDTNVVVTIWLPRTISYFTAKSTPPCVTGTYMLGTFTSTTARAV